MDIAIPLQIKFKLISFILKRNCKHSGGIEKQSKYQYSFRRLDMDPGYVTGQITPYVSVGRIRNKSVHGKYNFLCTSNTEWRTSHVHFNVTEDLSY